MNKKPLIGVSIIAGALLVLGSFSFFVICVSADEIQITVTGGIGYHATVYNPYNTSFNATLNVTALFTHQPIEDARWIANPHLSTTYFRLCA